MSIADDMAKRFQKEKELGSMRSTVIMADVHDMLGTFSHSQLKWLTETLVGISSEPTDLMRSKLAFTAGLLTATQMRVSSEARDMDLNDLLTGDSNE